MTRAGHEAAPGAEVREDSPRSERSDAVLACVEVGGGGVQTVLLDATGRATYLDEAVAPDGAVLLVAAPGLVQGTRVIAATNLGWFDVDPGAALGLTTPVTLLCNDAHAAALGEFALRVAGGDGGQGAPPHLDGLVYIGLGTGVGGAVVSGGPGAVVVSTEIGHTGPFGSRDCSCGRIGCLETVAGGWALPDPIDDVHARTLIRALARAIEADPAATPQLVVLGGGITGRYPDLVRMLGLALPERRVEASIAPTAAKSAAAWGMQHAYQRPRCSDGSRRQTRHADAARTAGRADRSSRTA